MGWNVAYFEALKEHLLDKVGIWRMAFFTSFPSPSVACPDGSIVNPPGTTSHEDLLFWMSVMGQRVKNYINHNCSVFGNSPSTVWVGQVVEKETNYNQPRQVFVF